MKGRSILLSSAVLALVGCGGDDGGSVSSVWEGQYYVALGVSQLGDSPTGPICLEITQNGAQVSGKAWVAGYLWGGSYSGTLSGSTFTGQVSGSDLNNSNVTVEFDGLVSGNQMNGTVTINGQPYDVTLTKKTDKSSCGWASRRLVETFGLALGSAISGDPSNPNSLGYTLASFITQVPRVNVKVDNQTYQNWWACIWEVRDKTGGTPSEYTLGGIIDTDNFSRLAGWYVKTASPSIGVDVSLNPQTVNASLDNTNNPALYTDGTLIFLANGANDTYYNDRTQVSSNNPFYVSPCIGGIQYQVYMSEISSFYIKFDGIGNDSNTHTFESPPNASLTNQNNNIPALYIEVVSCPAT